MNEAEVHKYFLERIRFHAKQILPPQLYLDYQAAIYIDVESRQLVLMLEEEVLAENIGPVVRSVRWDVPSSWWQQFKQEHYPRWALKRWPANLESIHQTLRWDQLALFPLSPIKTGVQHRGPVTMAYYREIGE